MIILSTLEKFTKSEAFTAVLEMKKTGEILINSDLDKLLNYFAAPIPKKPKTVEQWVGKACNPGDIREMCHYIHVVDGEALATDGHRMHWGATDLPDGLYDPKTLLPVTPQMMNFTTPDFNRVKKINANKTCSFNLMFASVDLESRKYKPFQFTTLDKAGAVNTKYLNDATNGDNTITVTVDTESDNNGCSGKSEFGNFRIMGIRT